MQRFPDVAVKRRHRNSLSQHKNAAKTNAKSAWDELCIVLTRHTTTLRTNSQLAGAGSSSIDPRRHCRRLDRRCRLNALVRAPEAGTHSHVMALGSDIPQWTDRYWIADGRSRAPCASMNFTLVISTRSHDSSPARSTQMVPEKVHAVPFTRNFDIVHVLTVAFLGFPCHRAVCVS